ncbi:MAG TPA: N-acetylneuraminate synthase family protein [Opitutaceae bacterium]|jgi:N-acetylneuraminate synthase|nr:N-acetylneuraminate synthase family protein [Opitutaceae bacterium]
MKKIYIIAEIGINHNGDLNIAKQLIDVAKECGCDAVKFQKRTINTVYSEAVLNAPRESPWGTTTRQQKEGLEFGLAAYQEINAYCRSKQIDWFASAWDVESQKFLSQFHCKVNKVASAMNTNRAFMEMVADERKPTLLSTGMCTLQQLDQAVEIFTKRGCPVTLMHTVSVYPCKEEQLNLACIHTLRQRYNLPIGYSGHEVSPIPSIIAAGLGVAAIERHITLDRAMYGSDQAASLERRGLEILVGGVRTAEVCFGTGEKLFEDAERGVAKKLRYWE